MIRSRKKTEVLQNLKHAEQQKSKSIEGIFAKDQQNN